MTSPRSFRPSFRLAAAVLALLVGACASSGGGRTEAVRNPRVYVAGKDALAVAASDALQRLRMEIVQAEDLDDGTYLLVGRLSNAYARGGGGGDAEVGSLQVTLEPLDGARTRVLVEPARSASYGGTQARRLIEDFYTRFEAGGLVPIE